MDRRILLVDDESDIREVLGLYLQDLDFEVLTAENGTKALALFEKHHPPLVLTDIKMPGIDGVELLRRIKQESPDTEVILITGHGDMELAVKSLKNEAADFITKPINDDILEAALNRVSEKIRLKNELREYMETLENRVAEQSARLVEAERLAAVGQAVEGLTTALTDLSGDLEGGIRYFNEMPCFVAVHNRLRRVVAANRLYQERLGNPIGGESWRIYPDKTQNDPCPVKRTLENGKGIRSRETLKYTDGSRAQVYVHTAPIRGKNGEVVLVMEVSADAGELDRLRRKLQTTEQHYRQLFDEAPCYITVHDKDFTIQDANRRFTADFGKSIGKTCYESYKHRKSPCTDCPVVRTFEDGESHDMETVVTAESGEQYNVLVRTAPLRDENNEITHVMELSTNITEIRRLQDHLTSLGLLIGSISHGIKGILTALDGGMYLVSSGFEKDNEKKIQEGWEIVREMIERIRKMVLDILFYAKKRELNWEQVDLQDFSEKVAKTVRPKTDKHGIRFETDFRSTQDAVTIDPGVVSSALVNLLENAVEACMADKKKTDHRVGFSVDTDENDIIFTVEDNGTGMDRETKEKMFTLFFSSKGREGTGLGLFVSNRVVRQHGGEITVESEPEKGTRFTISLPRTPPPEA
jgi:PAS domain S-box-containing protein